MNYKMLYAEDIQVGDVLTDKNGIEHLAVADVEYVRCEDCSISISGKCPIGSIPCGDLGFHFEKLTNETKE